MPGRVVERCEQNSCKYMHENNGKPFECYGMSYRVRAVSQYCKFPLVRNPLLQILNVLETYGLVL
jgi:hypothetical protein